MSVAFGVELTSVSDEVIGERSGRFGGTGPSAPRWRAALPGPVRSLTPADWFSRRIPIRPATDISARALGRAASPGRPSGPGRGPSYRLRDGRRVGLSVHLPPARAAGGSGQ